VFRSCPLYHDKIHIQILLGSRLCGSLYLIVTARNPLAVSVLADRIRRFIHTQKALTQSTPGAQRAHREMPDKRIRVLIAKSRLKGHGREAIIHDSGARIIVLGSPCLL
jgi:hypothetical protein